MTVDTSKYRFIWDFKNGKISFGGTPKTMDALRADYKRKGYTVKTEGKKLYIKRG